MILKVDNRRPVDDILFSGTNKVFKKRKIDAIAFKGLAADFVNVLTVIEKGVDMLKEPISRYAHDHLLVTLTASRALLYQLIRYVNIDGGLGNGFMAHHGANGGQRNFLMIHFGGKRMAQHTRGYNGY